MLTQYPLNSRCSKFLLGLKGMTYLQSSVMFSNA